MDKDVFVLILLGMVLVYEAWMGWIAYKSGRKNDAEGE